MEKIPFTSYDFWAYLSAGCLLLFAVDQALGTSLLTRQTWTVIQAVVAITCAYTVGHLIASMSSLLFERLLVGKLLGYPRNVLFGQPPAWKWIRRLIPGYFVPLPEATQKAALEKGGKFGVATPGDALFWSAYAHARATPAVMSRLENFLNQYGFCRNAAFVALLDAAILYWSYLQPGGPHNHLIWARIALLVGLGMTLRYLKFLRHYALELFTAFAYSNEPGREP